MPTSPELIAVLNNLDSTTYPEAERVRVQRALLRALRRTQLPFDTVLDHGWIEPATISFIRTLVDAGFWTNWVAAGGKPSSVKELTNLTEVDPALLERLLRFLAAQELINDKNGDGSIYELTDFSRALAGPEFPFVYPMHELINKPAFSNFPTFAAKTGYRNPADPANTNYQDWYGKGDLFAHLGSDPKVGESFNKTMGVVASMKVPWVDMYPTETIVADAKPGQALLVDVAGGLGHDLELFRAKHPAAQGLILQDLPAVIEEAQVAAPIEKQAIDMFNPQGQPVKGARVYFLKTVLHDFTDSRATEILKGIKKAMTPGYSRILLFESVIAANNANPRNVAQDATMMVLFSGGERIEQTWRKVVSDAGLKVAKIWSPELPDSIIEIEVPASEE